MADSAESAGPTTWCEIRQQQLKSRPLWCNPVCFLCSWATGDVTDACGEESTEVGKIARNMMTVSWLTPVDNQGRVILSLNANRHTLTLIRKTRAFVLSVAVEGDQEKLWEIGKCSGAQVDKIADIIGENSIVTPLSCSRLEAAETTAGATIGATTGEEKPSDPDGNVAAAADEPSEHGSEPGEFGRRGSPCHVACRVESFDENSVPGHVLVHAQVKSTFVKRSYFEDGKTFGPGDGSEDSVEDTPKPLTFLGSRTFAKTGRVVS